MKVLSADRELRPLDFADIAALLEAAGADEDAAIEQLLRLMTRRGFSRRQNLVVRFRKVRRKARGQSGAW